MPPAPPPAPPPAAIATSRWLWLSAAVPLAVGGFLGYQAAYAQSLGGFNTIAAGLLWSVIGVLAGIAGLVGIGNDLRPAGRGRAASRYSFAVAALIAAGGVGGTAAVRAFDLGYHEPVVLQARGDASAILDGVPAFVPRASGRADCRSVADGTDVERVTALSLGGLDGGPLRADIALPVGGLGGGYIALFVDAATLPSGSVPPTWEKAQPEIESAPSGASGSVRFDGAQLRTGDEMGAATGSWPTTLTGTITWSCGEWFAADATPPAAVEARVTLDLSGSDWRAAGGSQGSCEFEADGSVWTVTTGDAGLLRGEPLGLTLDLGGDPRPGDEVHLWLRVLLATPSRAASLPLGALVAATSGRTISWTELLTIDEVSPNGLSGRLAFDDVPMETTPDLAWPASLSGELAWECA